MLLVRTISSPLRSSGNFNSYFAPIVAYGRSGMWLVETVNSKYVFIFNDTVYKKQRVCIMWKRVAFGRIIYSLLCVISQTFPMTEKI